MARGTGHKLVLFQAGRRIRLQLQQARGLLQTKERALQALYAARKQAIAAATERRYVEAEFKNIPGIGPTTREKILRQVFHGRLDDLRKAHLVRGVGESRQRAINLWLAKAKVVVQAGTYSDKATNARIHSEYADRLRPIEDEIAALVASCDDLTALEQRIITEYNRLCSVTDRHFTRALMTPGLPSKQVPDFYLTGLFADWEPEPDWFRQAVELAEGRS